MSKYGRLLGWLYIGDAEVSLNEQMIDEGYAWEYDGGTKQKNLKNFGRFAGHMGHLFSILFAVTMWVQVHNGLMIGLLVLLMFLTRLVIGIS